MLFIKGAIDLVEMLRIAEARVIWLDLEGKARVVREHHRHRRVYLRAENLTPHFFDLGAHAFDLMIAAARRGVMIQQTMPVLFRAKAGGAPAEEQDRIRATRDRLVRPH